MSLQISDWIQLAHLDCAERALAFVLPLIDHVLPFLPDLNKAELQ